MSQSLSRNEGRQKQGGSVQKRWQDILDLGAQLSSLSQLTRPLIYNGIEYSDYPDRGIILAQRDTVIKATNRLIGGSADLWLPRWLGEEIGYLRRVQPETGAKAALLAELFAEHATSRLAICALEMRKLCVGNVSIDNPLAFDSSSDVELAAQVDPSVDSKTSALAVPLLGVAPPGELAPILGVLSVERTDGMEYKSAQINLFEGIARQTATALQASLQMALERWRIEQLRLVSDVSSQLTRFRDLDELARRVTRLILDTFDYYYVAIFTLEPGKEQLEFRASAGPGRPRSSGISPPTDYSPVLFARQGEGMIGRAAQTGQEILANRVEQEPTFRFLDSLPETKAEFTLPLKVDERLLGVLDVQSDLRDDFHAIDVLVLRALAGTIALAIESARLYSDLNARIDQLATIAEVGKAITSILDQDALLEQVVHLIHERFGHPFVHLFSVHPGRRKVFFEAGSGLRSELMSQEEFSYDLDDPDGIIPWVARSGETILANNVELEPRYRPSPYMPENSRAELALPLKYSKTILGVLDIQSDQEGIFKEEDILLFETLADHIAIAMRNASLYRSESWRRQAAESLREVAGLLSAEVDLNQVLTKILVELIRNLPCDLAAIWFLGEETEENWNHQDYPPLRLAAVDGLESAWLLPQVGLNLDEIFEVSSDEGAFMQYPVWLAAALESDMPVNRPAGVNSDVFTSTLEFPENYSAIAAPLMAGEKRLGVITLFHHTSGRYGSESRAMTAAFASYAAVAIQNTRLYESAHEQVWVSMVLLQVAEATQSINDLYELLEKVVNLTPMLVGVRSCGIYLLEGDRFVPAVANGLGETQQFLFENGFFSHGHVPGLDQLVEEHRPIILQRHSDDLRLASIFSADISTSEIIEFIVLVPIQVRGEVFGALVVNNSSDLLKFSIQSLETFFDERLTILQGIAQQTAIAIENIHLTRSQKEEAYVSVALLQVAQAIVSSNEIQETLGSIVRITPILTGVRRAAIYLWNKQSYCFDLAQSYGLPRDADVYTYAPSEFPVLQAVLEQNTIIASQMIAENLGENDDRNDVPEIWTYLTPPDLSEVENVLAIEERLLLGFPLSVKGDVMGVFLIEEPEPSKSEGMMGMQENLRLRSKRVEITMGISQQAALAIQNDQLQREMVNRERFDREMQLAREIQRTFLPHELPDLPEWDVHVWWRTAREMGGDFYDFIPLPGNKLGIVIADVADKGMPAALFMILIRTLVRAAVRDSSSPAEVLKRVNNLLVPDAQQSMFVTLFYGCLDPATGRLDYANAGHNPPLWCRRSTQFIEPLTRTAMALGIDLDTPVDERQVLLEPGDYLVLYTDGVTDSFSPDGLIYGTERLEQTVWEVAFNQEEQPASARIMLESIDYSVVTFTEGTPAQDDSTALVFLRRLG